MKTYMAERGWGYHFDGCNFARLGEDTLVKIAADEYARPNYAIVYRVSDGRRMHIPKQALREIGAVLNKAGA